MGPLGRLLRPHDCAPVSAGWEAERLKWDGRRFGAGRMAGALLNIANERSNTIVFPVPIDVLDALRRAGGKA